MDDGRIPLSPAQVVELGERAQRRLSRIAGILLVLGAILAIGFIALWARHRPFDAIRGLPTAVALFALALERMAKAKTATRAARLAKTNAESQWHLDGYRVLSNPPAPPYMFRISKKMLAELTAMPTATVVSK